MFLSVAFVLGAGRRAQIGPAVVKAVMVNMIHKHIIGDFEHLAVHVEFAPFAPSVNPTSRVERRAALDGKPFTFGKPKIIIRIDDGVLSPRQRYPAKGIAVANPPI